MCAAAMQDATTSLDTLTRLRLQGFQLSIDDFGTGYSSMVQLVRLPRHASRAWRAASSASPPH